MRAELELRQPNSRYAVAYPGSYVPLVVWGWFRWSWQAERRRRALASGPVGHLRFETYTAEEIDAAWAAFEAREDRR